MEREVLLVLVAGEKPVVEGEVLLVPVVVVWRFQSSSGMMKQLVWRPFPVLS